MINTELPRKRPKLPPTRVISAVNQIRNSMSKLNKKMVPPPVALLEMISGMWVSRAIGVVASLGVADHVAEGGSASDELASKTGANPEALYRILRALTVVGVLEELENRRFKLTAIGRCLKSDHPQSMRYMAMFQSELNWPHWEKLDYSVKTGSNAVEHVRGMKPFDFLSKSPKHAETFDKAMVNISRMEVDSILAAYDFSQFKVAADIGGGYGAFLASVLSVQPGLKGILFDMPHVVEGSKAFMRQHGLADRVEFHGGSFFDSVPAGADVYMMKHIIHDWSDEHSIKILSNIRAKMGAEARLLLFETVIPDRGVADFSKFLDLEMLVVTQGGKERTHGEFQSLLAKAGFKLDRVLPTISMASVIEASPA